MSVSALFPLLTIGLLIAVILIIRVLPDGFSGWLARRSS